MVLATMLRRKCSRATMTSDVMTGVLEWYFICCSLANLRSMALISRSFGRWELEDIVLMVKFGIRYPMRLKTWYLSCLPMTLMLGSLHGTLYNIPGSRIRAKVSSIKILLRHQLQTLVDSETSLKWSTLSWPSWLAIYPPSSSKMTYAIALTKSIQMVMAISKRKNSSLPTACYLLIKTSKRLSKELFRSSIT